MSRVLPILFNTEMVRAIMDGRKTVTRRIMKPQPTGKVTHNIGYKIDEWGEVKEIATTGKKYFSQFKLPYQSGDILYVRETYKRNIDGYHGIDFGGYIYKADCAVLFKDPYNPWRPSIHMPKAAARIWLKVTDVRVERLQDITPKQIDAEGCKEYGYSTKTGELMPSTPAYFSIAWNRTIKKPDLDRYGWNANPFVWVIEFERCEKPKEE